MKKKITILLLLLTLLSCSKNRIENIDGIWERVYSEKPKNIHFPFELSFEKDSLILSDNYNFKHQVSYKVSGDSIEMNFNNNISKKIHFKSYSDSIISLDSKKFYKKTELFFNRPPYDLLNHQTNETLTNYGYSSIIHLVKENNMPKVILNDKVSNLDKIPGFLGGWDKNSPSLILYIQKGIEFKDLIETYFWLELLGFSSVILVTKNDAYQKFYSIKDNINISDSLRNQFTRKLNVPPPPIADYSKKIKRVVLKIDRKYNFENLPNITDNKQYLLEVSNELDLIQYLKLTEKIKDMKNVKKEITAYNKGDRCTTQ